MSDTLNYRLVLDRQLFKKSVQFFEAVVELVAKELPVRPSNLALVVDLLRSDHFFSVDHVRVCKKFVGMLTLCSARGGARTSTRS